MRGKNAHTLFFLFGFSSVHSKDVNRLCRKKRKAETSVNCRSNILSYARSSRVKHTARRQKGRISVSAPMDGDICFILTRGRKVIFRAFFLPSFSRPFVVGFLLRLPQPLPPRPQTVNSFRCRCVCRPNGIHPFDRDIK